MKYPKPTAEIDFLRAAKILIDEYGDDALLIAAQRADAFLARGDFDGQRAWKVIYKTIAELQRTTRTAGDRLH
jgi:hypothetical protein